MPVVYFFHGLGGDEETWIKQGYLRAKSEYTNLHPDATPTAFVSFSTEIGSFFSDFQGANTGSRAWETWLIKEFIPRVETRFSIGGTQDRRCFAGLSMGGFGAMKTALRNPGLASFVAANSPALPPFSIHRPNAQWRDFFRNTSLGIVRGMRLLSYVRRVFPTQELFEYNNPIDLVLANPDKYAIPAMYFDMGSEDDFGFNFGYELLVDALRQKNANFKSVLVHGADHYLYKEFNAELIRATYEWSQRAVLKE